MRDGHGATGQTPKIDNENYDENDEDEPAVFLNKSARLPRVSTLTERGRRLPKYLRKPVRHYHTSPTPTNVFQELARQQKRVEHMQRLGDTEADMYKFLEEFPNDNLVRGKLLYIQTCKARLEREGANEILNRSEVKFMYEIGRLMERRRIANESKALLKRSQIEAQSRGGGTGGGKDRKGKKRDREEAVDRSSSPSLLSRSVRNGPYSLPHLTAGEKTAYQHQKRQRFVSDDEDGNKSSQFEEDEEEEHKTYGGKTLSYENVFNVENYDVQAVLKDQEEEGEENDNDKIDEESEDSEDSDGSSGDGSDFDLM